MRTWELELTQSCWAIKWLENTDYIEKKSIVCVLDTGEPVTISNIQAWMKEKSFCKLFKPLVLFACLFIVFCLVFVGCMG